MRTIPEFTPEGIRWLLFRLSTKPDNREDEYSRVLNNRREFWQTLDNDLQLIEDLLQFFETTPADQSAIRQLILLLLIDLIHDDDFDTGSFDSRRTPWTPSLQAQRDASTSISFWWPYLMVKSLLRDPTVIPENITTWRATDTLPDTLINKVTRARLIQELGYVGSETATRLLSHRLHEARDAKERHAMQYELILLDWPVDPLPEFEPLELARNGMAALAHSYLTRTPHPELLQFLSTDGFCRHCVHRHCTSRPPLRRLCRGPSNWATNLIGNLSQRESTI